MVVDYKANNGKSTPTFTNLKASIGTIRFHQKREFYFSVKFHPNVNRNAIPNPTFEEFRVKISVILALFL